MLHQSSTVIIGAGSVIDSSCAPRVTVLVMKKHNFCTCLLRSLADLRHLSTQLMALLPQGRIDAGCSTAIKVRPSKLSSTAGWEHCCTNHYLQPASERDALNYRRDVQQALTCNQGPNQHVGTSSVARDLRPQQQRVNAKQRGCG
jgi:hypothetical protein